MKKISILSSLSLVLIFWISSAYGQDASSSGGMLSAAREVIAANKDAATAQNSAIAQAIAPDPVTAPATATDPAPATATVPSPAPISPTKDAAAAPGVVSTSQAIDQIEKSLLSSDKTTSPKGRNFTAKVKRANNNDDTTASKFQMVIVDTKNDSKYNEKQKMAYSASLVNQYEVAIELYKQMLKSEPKNDYTKFALATSYHKIGQYRQAKTLYSELLKSSTVQNKEEVVGNLLEIIAYESPKDAIYLLAKLSAQSPDSAYILSRLALVYDKVGRTDQAILLLNRATALDPEKIGYKFNLAVIYDKNKDYTKALDFYNQVITSYVESDDIDRAIPILEVKNRAAFIRNSPVANAS